MSEQRSATGELRREHRVILKVATVLERVVEEAGPADLPLDTVGECVTFFRLFTDACHHAKEEDLLFAELEERGFPRDQGPVAVMLEEHRAGRALVGRMAAALESTRTGDLDAWHDLTWSARQYIDLIRQHIRKEDGVLFTMADQMVAGDACRRLCEAYDAVGCRGTGERSAAELESRALALAARFGID